MKTRGRATLSDVASRADVSRTTASYILNGRSAQMRISAETVERVGRAARELGYRPNRSARNLRTGITKTVGLICDFVASGHFASQMLRGASSAAIDSGHLLVIGESEGDPRVEQRLVEDMIDRQVDGIVYATLVTAQVKLPVMLEHQHVVLLNCIDPEAGRPAVLPDELEGGRTAAELLLQRGMGGDVLLVGEDPTPDAIAGRLRTEGVLRRLAEAGHPPAPVLPCEWDVIPAFDAMTTWLDTGARCDALICLNDRVAMGTYQALEAHGLRVPDDVCVVSFDGSELATWLRPSLASVTVPYADMGVLAVKRLLDRADHLARDSEVWHVPMPVLPGNSVPGGSDGRLWGKVPLGW